ncbi:uracil-DNA glycosylase [Candidatus Poribacteria bacterium]|nr:uracil-DNA glycosylase [Candidatus Poribacteria bacterium]
MSEKSSNTEKLLKIKKRAVECIDCNFSQTRKNVVFGSGDPESKLVVIAEGPSAADNHTSFPFSGPAGNMLDEVFAANELTRADIWLTNIIKCRAADQQQNGLKNRLPKIEEIKACAKWLDNELTIIKPFVILCLGSPAAKTLIHSSFKITGERGIWFTETRYSPFAMATYNPAYVLRQEGDDFMTLRSLIIEDISKAKQKLADVNEYEKTTLF